jgi:hypothetical protein
LPRRQIGFDTVREIGLSFPDVEEGTTYGTPALKVRGRVFAFIPIHRSAEPGSLGVMLDVLQRDELLEADPDTYYLKEHYRNYPVVLVRLAHIHRDALRDLLREAWRRASALAVKKRRRPGRSEDRPLPKR